LSAAVAFFNTKESDLRNKALIALLVHAFVMVGAAISIKVEDVYIQGSGNVDLTSRKR
jgi:hypothetical protein